MLELQFALSTVRLCDWSFWVHNADVTVTVAMMVHGALTVLGNTYSFWSFAGKLKRRCAVEMQLRGKDAPWIPSNWAVAVLLVGIVLPWAAMGGGIAAFGPGLIAGLLTLIGSAPFVLVFVYLLRAQWHLPGASKPVSRFRPPGARQVDKPVADEKMGPAETAMAYGCAILLLGVLAWLDVVFPVLIAFGVNLDATHGHSHR